MQKKTTEFNSFYIGMVLLWTVSKMYTLLYATVEETVLLYLYKLLAKLVGTCSAAASFKREVGSFGFIFQLEK